MMTLDDMRIAIENLASKISAPSSTLPTFGETEHTARPHIEIDERGYHYVVVERGQEYERRTTPDYRELLYWVFEKITFNMAIEYELHHRVIGQDCRRITFQRQLVLLADVDPKFAERQELEQQQILREHPFDDDSFMRLFNLRGNR